MNNHQPHTFVEAAQQLCAAVRTLGSVLFAPIMSYVKKVSVLPYVQLISIVLLYAIVISILIATLGRKSQQAEKEEKQSD